MSEREKLAVRLEPELRERLERCYTMDGSRSRREYIENAIRFYTDYQEIQSAQSLLPKEIITAIDGRLGMMEDRMASLLFKHSVELDMVCGLLSSAFEIDEESLRREDAARLGYDSATPWRNLIRAHRNDIAAAMKIPPKDFRWYAAFHDEGEHPHIHMMAWSAKPGQAYLSREGIRQIKSVLMNDVFKQELLHVYEQKSVSRDELVRQARREMLELVRAMQTGLCDHPEVETLMLQLAQGLETVRGKKSYGYLPKLLKAITDQIVDQMERIPAVTQCYEMMFSYHRRVLLSKLTNAPLSEAGIFACWSRCPGGVGNRASRLWPPAQRRGPAEP